MNSLSGQGLVYLDNQSIPCKCELIQGGRLIKEVSFRCHLPSMAPSYIFQHGKAVRLKADFLNEEVDGFLLSSPHFLETAMAGRGGSVEFIIRSSRTPLLHHTSEPLVLVTAKLINFGGYFLKKALLLRGEGWQIELAQVSAEDSEDEGKLEYVVSHSVTIKREDLMPFGAEEAHILLNDLSTYLSFCHERWVAPSFSRGFSDGGNLVMQEYGTRKILSYQDASGWADRHYPSSIAEAFPGYLRLMKSPAQAEAIRHCIYWYLRADTNLVGPDGSIILLQAALERLAWQVLVEAGTTSKTKFRGSTSKENFCQLFAQLSIPRQIPDTLTELKGASIAIKWRDAVDAWTKVRNELVHPEAEHKGARLPLYETYLLGKWWVELSLLRLFGFNGTYLNRTLKHRWVGQVEQVPWAQTCSFNHQTPALP